MIPAGHVRVVEVLAALSLTTDLASGVPFEKGLRTCVVATALGRALALDGTELRVVFQAALLRAVGCTSHASENAEMFDDDVAFQARLKVMDIGDPEVFGRQLAGFGAWAAPPRAARLRRRFRARAPVVGPDAARAGCEVSRALGTRLGLVAGAVAALDEVYERWDGLGIPDGRAGERLTVAARIVHVAEQAVFAHADGGPAAALAEVRRRAGGHLDPGLCAALERHADAVFAELAHADVLARVAELEPGPRMSLPFGEIERLCDALATVADLKGRWLIGHAQRVADLVSGAATTAGVDPRRSAMLRSAALVQDIGRVAVPSSVWDRAGALGPVDLERVRLHPYWTQRILARCPATAPLADLAAAHHERCDGTGYHRGRQGAEISLEAGLLAAADCFVAITSARPHRPAATPAAAAVELTGMVAAGMLDATAVAAVVEAAGLPRPQVHRPDALTEREVEVVRLAARGLSNRGIGESLGISARTVGHHLAHVYDKTGVRTRAGIAVYAVQHGLFGGHHGERG